MYTFSEAARLAHVSPSTVRNWLFGYTVKGERDVPPLFGPSEGQGAMVSFIQLVEIEVAGRLRKAEHVSFATVRRGYDNAKQLFDLENPFAHLTLSAMGGHIVHLIHSGGSLRALDDLHQWTLPGLVDELIGQIDYEEELAARWWPEGKEVPIVVDPRYSSGVPTIAGRGVTISAIRSRFREGRLSIDFIAQDYQLKRDEVEQAIRFAEQLAA